MKFHVERVPEGMKELKIRHTVTVKSNDPERKITRLRVTATAVKARK